MVETVVALLAEHAERDPHGAAYIQLAAGGAPADETLTWSGWLESSRAIAAALVEAGHLPGDRIAVLADNRPLWPLAEMGILMAGCVAVGIYPTSAPEQIQQVLADSGATALFVDTPERLQRVDAVRRALPRLRDVVALHSHAPADDSLHGWLGRGSRSLAGGGHATLCARGRKIGGATDAILVYTSGSTGVPRGARLSHRTLLASAASIRDTLGLAGSDSSLSFLPFCHAAERVFGLYARLLSGMTGGLVEDHRRVWDAAAAFRPSVFGGLPRLYERAYEQMLAAAAVASPAERERFARTLELGRERSRLRAAGAEVPENLEREWSEVGLPWRTRLQSLFGGGIRLATSGGAALPPEVAETLDALGLSVLGAYGLSEHLCAVFNRPDRYRFDASGWPMPGTELRLAGDGEILIRKGPLTFLGYHARPTETRESFTADGAWLLTGDLGEIDGDGALRVTGRKKELIALSSGKKIAPLPIESMLARDHWVGQAVVLGEGRRYPVALLSLRRGVVETWAAEEGLDLPFAELLAHPRVLARVQQTVDAINARLSGPERIRRFVLLERELTQESDELTPTLKVRRPVVAEHFRAQVEALYETTP